MRRKFIAGNWKMNTNRASAIELAKVVAAGVGSSGARVAVCPPAVYLEAVAATLAGSRVELGAKCLLHKCRGFHRGKQPRNAKGYWLWFGNLRPFRAPPVFGETDEFVAKGQACFGKWFGTYCLCGGNLARTTGRQNF